MLINTLRIWAFSLAFGLATTMSAVANDADILAGFVSELKTYEARFEQSQCDPRGIQVQFSTGFMALSRPGKFRWVYETPYEQQLISDGESLWVYDPDLDQATRKALTGSIDTSPIMILMDEKPLTEVYDIRLVGEDDGMRWFSLMAHDGRSDFNQILIGMDEQGLASMQLIDAFDNVTRVSFMDRKVNRPLDMDQFDFTPPEGVDVVETR